MNVLLKGAKAKLAEVVNRVGDLMSLTRVNGELIFGQFHSVASLNDDQKELVATLDQHKRELVKFIDDLIAEHLIKSEQAMLRKMKLFVLDLAASVGNDLGWHACVDLSTADDVLGGLHKSIKANAPELLPILEKRKAHMVAYIEGLFAFMKESESIAKL